MSGVTIKFRGVMLFKFDRERRDVQVIIPNADEPKVLRDKTIGRRHYAYLRRKRGSALEYVSLLRQDILFESYSGEGAPQWATPDMFRLDHLIDTSRAELLVAHDSPAANDDIVACRLTLKGGTMSRTKPLATDPEQQWKLGNALGKDHTHLRPALEVTWESLMPTLKAKDGSLPELSASDTEIIIGNLDLPPERWQEQLDNPGNCRPGSLVADRDFKWLYELLEPTGSNTWDSILNGKRLPRPETLCDRVENVSTCYGSGWGGPPAD